MLVRSDWRNRPQLRTAKRLQLVNRRAQVFHRDVFGEAGVSDGMSNDKSDAAVYKFLVARNRVEDPPSREIGRQNGWKVVRLERSTDLASLACRQAGSLHGYLCGRNHPETERFAVQQCAVASRDLDRMSHGMAKVQECADVVSLTLIRRDDGRFDREIPFDEEREF
jgi:hypothetical protein